MLFDIVGHPLIQLLWILYQDLESKPKLEILQKQETREAKEEGCGDKEDKCKYKMKDIRRKSKNIKENEEEH